MTAQFGNKESSTKRKAGVKPNKFLPFITDASSAESIFKTLLQRSKGLSCSDIAAIYTATVSLGITAVNGYVKTLPSKLETSEIFDMVANYYKKYTISVNELTFWMYVIEHYGLDKIDNSGGYEAEELAIMVASLAKFVPEKLPSIGFNHNPDLLVQFSKDNFNGPTSLLVNMDFETDGKRLGFKGITEFKAYVAYYQCVPSSDHLSVFPVLIDINRKHLSDKEYATYGCVSPYKKMPKKLPEGDDDADFPL